MPENSRSSKAIFALPTVADQILGQANFADQIVGTTKLPVGTTKLPLGITKLPLGTTKLLDQILGSHKLPLRTTKLALGTTQLPDQILGTTKFALGTTQLPDQILGTTKLALGTTRLPDQILGTTKYLDQILGTTKLALGTAKLPDQILGTTKLALGITKLPDQILGTTKYLDQILGTTKLALGTTKLPDQILGSTMFAQQILGSTIPANAVATIGWPYQAAFAFPGIADQILGSSRTAESLDLRGLVASESVDLTAAADTDLLVVEGPQADLIREWFEQNCPTPRDAKLAGAGLTPLRPTTCTAIREAFNASYGGVSARGVAGGVRLPSAIVRAD